MKKLTKKPSLNLKPLSADQAKKVVGGIGWPSHAAA